MAHSFCKFFEGWVVRKDELMVGGLEGCMNCRLFGKMFELWVGW